MVNTTTVVHKNECKSSLLYVTHPTSYEYSYSILGLDTAFVKGITVTGEGQRHSLERRTTNRNMVLQTETKPALEASQAESATRSKVQRRKSRDSDKKKEEKEEQNSEPPSTSGDATNLSDKENGLSTKQDDSSDTKDSGPQEEGETANETDDSSSPISRRKTSSEHGSISTRRSASKSRRSRHRSKSPALADGSRPGRSMSKTRSRKRDKSVTVSSRSRSLSISAPKSRRGKSVPRTRSSDDLGPSAGSKHRKTRRRVRRLDGIDSASSHDEISLTTSLSMKEEIKKKAQSDHHASLNALVYKLRDTSLEEELVGLFKRIEDADGIPLRRETPPDANPIADSMIKTLRNDPEIRGVRIQDDKTFHDVEKGLPVEFAEGLRPNLHLRSLFITGVGLRDDFLLSISSSIRDNFTLENLVLANNCFTSSALAEFCICLGLNVSLRHVDLRDQNPSVTLLKEHEKEAMDAVASNKYIHVLRMDVASEKFQEMIEKTLEKNKKTPKYLNYDKKLLKYCEEEARNAEQLFQLNLIEEKLKHQFKKEISLLANLAEIAKINKVDIRTKDDTREGNNDAEENPDCQDSRQLPADDEMTSDGAFLDEEFISRFIEADPSSLGVVFNFNGQEAFFRKFNPSHESRKAIVTKFVDLLVNHTQAAEITRITMRESACRDDFVIALCQKCQGNSKVLPKLFLLDLGMNCISDAGVAALSACMMEKKSLRYLQVLILQNQRSAAAGKRIYFSTSSELMLAKALCQNLSILRLSLKIRNVPTRQKLEGYLARNLDLLEQARLIKELTGRIKHARNELEQQIDRLSSNDPALWHVDFSGDQRFLSLKRKDVLKVAKALWGNKFITEVRLDRLKLNDDFAVHLSESIENNSSIRVVSLEGNEISGTGINIILSGLVKNATIVEVNLRNQTESMSGDEEKEILASLGDNRVVRKLGLDIENEDVLEELAKRLANNQQSQWRSQRKSIE